MKGEKYTKGDRVELKFEDGWESGVVMRGGKNPRVALDGSFTKKGDSVNWKTYKVPAINGAIRKTDDPLPEETNPPEDDPFYSRGFYGVKWEAKPRWGPDSMQFRAVLLRNGEETGIVVEDTGMGGGAMVRFRDEAEEHREAYEAAIEEYPIYKGYEGPDDTFFSPIETWLEVWLNEEDFEVPANRPFSVIDSDTKEEYEARYADDEAFQLFRED